MQRHMLQRLREYIKILVTGGIKNAIDCSEPTKWRRTVADHAPGMTASFGGASEGAPNASKSDQAVIFQLLLGYLEAVTLAVA